MAVDPYTTLGVKTHATQEEIQKAYRRLAKKLHPDLNPGNKIAEDKFKEVSAAYDLLGDPEKRARFDRGEIDASGTERPRRQYYRDFADQNGWSAYTNNSGFSDFGDFAGHIEADHDRQRHLDAGHSFYREHIMIVERRGAHADHDASGFCLRLRVVYHYLQIFQSAVLAQQQRLHRL